MMTELDRAVVLNKVIEKVGARRAVESAKSELCLGQSTPNPWGFDGVDKADKRSRKFRARIRYCDALNGRDVRLTLGSFDSAEAAGYAYCVAHTQLYGAGSRYAGDNVKALFGG